MNARLRSLLGVVSVGALAVLGLACGSAPTDGDDAVSSSSEEALKDKSFDRVVRTMKFTGADGNPVRYRVYDYKAGEPEAFVIFLNGRGEFMEKYDVLFSSIHDFPAGAAPANETLADMPVTFVAIDHEGQGGSMKGRIPGDVADFDNFVKDVRSLFDLVPHMAEHKVPVFIVSHSMGGLIAARFAETYQGMIDGLVLSSPMFQHNPPSPLSLQMMQGIGYYYAKVAGVPGLCTQPKGVDMTYVAANALLRLDPQTADCFDSTKAPPYCPYLGYDFNALNGLDQYLKSLPPGCELQADTCPDPTLTSDNEYCQYYYTNPMRAPAATMGWLYESFVAQAEYAGWPIGVNVPVLLMSNTNDVIVDPSAHVCAGNLGGDCKLVQYTGFGHELLSSAQRAQPIGEIRAFINAHIK